MGNTQSVKSSDASEKTTENNFRRNRVLFFLHRTWAVIVTKKSGASDASSDYDSRYSQYSFCSCSHCQVDDGFSSWCASDFFDSGSSMAPNSEEGGRFGCYPFGDDSLEKEKQRPPIYNPEDYALSLKKWGRKPPNGGSGLYATTSASESDSSRTKSNSYRDYSNPMLMSAGSEMTLRQFGTVSELLMKLKADLRLAYPSFVQEFVADPLDGITLLLELLRIIQMNQANNNNVTGSSNTIGKIPPSVQKRALLDELSCLQCILCCCNRYSEAIRKLPASSTGLYTLAVCIMSNVNKSRIIALQLLTKACEPPGNGHTSVSEAMSTLRLRYGEPVRFRFLIGMLMSAGGQGDLLTAGMQFLNTFLDTCESPQKRIYIQAELEQAGFDINGVKKIVNINSPTAEKIFEQLDRWDKKHIDVEVLTSRMKEVTDENDSLRDKVLLLERRIQILQEEKGILMSLEQCLKERCSELQDEVTSLKSPKNTHRGSSKRSGSTPAEDEGISSSERSLTPEGDVQRDSSVYEMYNVQSQTIPVNNKEKPIQTKSCIRIKDDDEETTIDEVIEELKNIINDAETEQYLKEQKLKKESERKTSKVCMRVETSVSEQSLLEKENEIIPANLHPQPPRRTRSLVHLFIPAEDYDYDNKEIFFENETTFTSEEGSDSLLSASKYHLPRLDKDNLKSCDDKQKLQRCRNSLKRSESFKHLLPITDGTSAHSSRHGSFHGVVVITENTPLSPSFQEEKRNTMQELTTHRLKSKSLDRIDDGLDAMVDIVVTEKPNETLTPANQAVKIVTRSASNVFGGNKKEEVKRNSVEERKKIFLPNQKLDSSQYFPRLQEKRNTSNFLIKRGHMNAGLYSGYIIKEDQQGSYKKKSEYVTTMNNKNSLEKVTDSPSGLY